MFTQIFPEECAPHAHARVLKPGLKPQVNAGCRDSVAFGSISVFRLSPNEKHFHFSHGASALRFSADHSFCLPWSVMEIEGVAERPEFQEFKDNAVQDILSESVDVEISQR